MENMFELIKKIKPLDEWPGVKNDGAKAYYHDLKRTNERQKEIEKTQKHKT